MSSQEDTSDTPECPNGDIFKPKKKPKAIRVLTVMAYVLSVSMAAILLSIYYIFMWKPRPHIGAYTSTQVANGTRYNNSPIERHVRNNNFTEEPMVINEKISFQPPKVLSNSADITSEILNKSNVTRNAKTNKTPGPTYPTPDADDNHNLNYNSTANYNTTGEHDMV